VIRTLVVDDDYMSASIHRSYVERVPGFSVVGEAHSGAEALMLVERLRPDLVLLDIYLPDIDGLEVIRRLRLEHEQSVDVIAVTAAKDVKTLRSAMQGGVVQYLVKPFQFEMLRDRLERYAALARRFERLEEATQGDVDQLFSLLRVEGGRRLPKGISAPTLELVVDTLREAGELTAVDAAARCGISRGTARRYLDYLASVGSVELSLRYGAAGRPEHVYKWTPVPVGRSAG
jgi:response regulator of citrate/malate metabolism